MDAPDAPQVPPVGSWPGCTASCPPGEHTHYVGSYAPLIPVEPVVVDAEDTVPLKGIREVDVWLTGWQVEEDGFDVVLDEQIDWSLVPMDQQWLTHLFMGRRDVPLQRDTYAGASGEMHGSSSWTQLVGRVTRVDQVSVRHPEECGPGQSGEGLAEVGGAMQHTVLRVQKSRGHHGNLVGWIVRVKTPAGS